MNKIFLRKKHTDKKSGFSMIELIVVIVVMGILISIATLSYSGITKKITAPTITSCIRQFLFLKLLVAVARLQICNRSDCANTKKPGNPRFLYL